MQFRVIPTTPLFGFVFFGVGVVLLFCRGYSWCILNVTDRADKILFFFLLLTLSFIYIYIYIYFFFFFNSRLMALKRMGIVDNYEVSHFFKLFAWHNEMIFNISSEIILVFILLCLPVYEHFILSNILKQFFFCICILSSWPGSMNEDPDMSGQHQSKAQFWLIRPM